MQKRMELLMALPNHEVISSFMLQSLPDADTTGRVHSVFKTSFNINVKDKLFNFSSQGMPLSAHGCLLNEAKIKQLLAACKVGNAIRVNKTIITFYASHEIIKIKLDQLNEVDLRIPIIQKGPREISESVLYSTLGLLQLEEKIGLDTGDKIKEIFTVLKRPSNYNENEIKNAVQLLIGRGKGLTPSGDDILMGYLMVKKAFGRKASIEDLIKNEMSREITTEISEAYYQALFLGSISSLFVQLILSLLASEEQVVLELINQIGLYGHTSGNDTLFGFYLGLQSLINEMENDT